MHINDPHDTDPVHEQYFERVLAYLLTPPHGPVRLPDIDEGDVAMLLADDQMPVEITGVRPLREEPVTDHRGVYVELSDRCEIAITVHVVRHPAGQSTLASPAGTYRSSPGQPSTGT